ncbi:MAG: peptide chain release factor N(5)-glutamine methyltransferase [Verrucomicrobiota bacterium]|nr:peptide chain release factor N(5)-glutamine methyltransferase [Verrucomicrobiota bacterium]
MTILEIIKASSDFLARKGVDSPRLQSELLLAHVLEIPRLKLYLQFERGLEEQQISRMRELVRRRGNREPLQHLVGSVSFCGYEIEVNRSVLIPRPETELLAEQAWKFLKGLDGATTLLDWGTGSGCLPIAILLNAPDASAVALDISAAALEVAQRNVARHGLQGRIELWESDGFSAIPGLMQFDLIVSNPPYIPSHEIDSLQPEVKEFDPRLALDGSVDGLKRYRELAEQGRRFMKPGGKIMLELGDGQGEAVREIFTGQNWIVETILNDYSDRQRVFIGRIG